MTRAHAQDPLAEARQLYASAEYEDALERLDGLSIEEELRDERQAIELYRTLSLLALGRQAEANRVIEAMIGWDPLYYPGDDLSPRVRAAFTDVKRRVLPVIVQQHYSEAKTAFDRKDFEAAARGFTRVVAALDDPAITVAATKPPLADLRMLATGFRDLSVTAAAPPPPPPPPPPSPPVVPAPPPNLRGGIYTGEERDVLPPRAIQQELPRYPASVPLGGATEGIVEVLINEKGLVESATMVVPLALAMYNRLVLSAASGWAYHPATVNGVPVKFRKRIQITLAPASK
jgi:outer membrane biosynthesis protein TonB